jgi:predicted transport protein
MPLFAIDGHELQPVPQSNFLAEKALQRLVEGNLAPVFNCRLVASEFSTGELHGGRVDTLALSEDSNPVIIEYKKVESSELINQSLFYLAWIRDHRGNFEIAVQRALGPKTRVDWSDVRVICLAPNYKKYDLHAVQMMGANIELWTYRLFNNSTVYFEDVLQKSYTQSGGVSKDIAIAGKNPIMVAAGKKAALARATGTYSFDQHIQGKPEEIRQLARSVQEFIIKLDTAIEEVPKKLYIAYRISQNILCMEIQKQKILLYLKLNPTKHSGPKGISRDVTNIGHYATGNLEVTLRQDEDLKATNPWILKAYQAVGG